MSQKIRIKLKSYDHNLVDKSAEKIVRTVKATGAIVSGPIPLPTHKRIFTVNRSTFVNKKSREQFELGQVSLGRYACFLEMTGFGLGSMFIFLVDKPYLYSLVPVFFNGFQLRNYTRTNFDNSAWYIFTLGTENGCHSDFFS